MIDNNKIIDALLTTGSRSEAAKVANCNVKTIQRRFEDGSFRQDYQLAVQRRLTEGGGLLAAKMETAIETICQIMTDEEVSAGTRLAAAQTVLKYAAMLSKAFDQSDGASLEELVSMML